MIFFSYARYVLLTFARATVVISSLSDESVDGTGTSDFTTQNPQNVPIPAGGDPTATFQGTTNSLDNSAWNPSNSQSSSPSPNAIPVGEDPTATFQGTTNSFDNSAWNPSNSQSSNLSPNDKFNAPLGPVNGGENLAFLLDGSTGEGEGTGISIPSFPIQIFDGIPEFVDGIRQWFTEPKEPECKVNKHALCCQKPAPKPRVGKAGGRVPVGGVVVEHEPLEYSQRRKKCSKWSAEDPACKFPENIFCCYCQDYNYVAYFCYNQPYQDNPEFNTRPIPDPREVSKPKLQPNQKRDSIGSLASQDDLINNGMNMDNSLYAELDPADQSTRGRKRNPETCTDKFLESVGVSTYRYRYPSRLPTQE